MSTETPSAPGEALHRSENRRLRASDVVLLCLAAGLGAVALTVSGGAPAKRVATADLAARLGLTDLALFTEARYTRHPSMADLHSAFQDHPLALEHFPSGSLVAPPDRWGAAR